MSLLAPSQTKRIDSDYYIEGYATTFTTPYLLYEYEGNKYFETVARDALMGADVSDVIMQYDHSGHVFARNSNGTLGIDTDDHGLFVYADLSKSEAARRMYEEISNGLVTKMSWAFTIADDDYDRDLRTRTIKRIKKVYDVSAVSIPANNDTTIAARSYVEGVIDMEKREAQARQLEVAKAKFYYMGGLHGR